MPRMKILNSVEREVFDFPPIFNSDNQVTQSLDPEQLAELKATFDVRPGSTSKI
jgi:hypothetical protein